MIQLRGNRAKKAPRRKAGGYVHFKVPRAALALWYFTGTDDNRHNIQNILIEPEVTTVGKVKHIKAHAVATDGHRLLHVWWNPSKGEKFAPKTLLNRTAVERHLKEGAKGGSIFARGKGLEFSISEVGHQTLLKNSAGHSSVVFDSVKTPDVQFPEWRQVIPKRDDSDSATPQTYGMNIHYLDDFRKYLVEFVKSEAGPGVKFNYVNPPFGPMILIPAYHDGDVEIEYALKMERGASAEYIVMPMRVD